MKLSFGKLRRALQAFETYASPRPVTLDWAVTGHCNARCVFCEAPGISAKAALPTERMLTIVDEMAEMGVEEVLLVGGEPFIRKDLWEILARLESRKIRVSAISNGIVISSLSSNELALLSERGSRLSLSIDSSQKAQCDIIRGVPGIYEKLLSAIGRAREAGIRDLSLNAVIGKDNLKEISPLIELAAQEGIPFVHFQPVSPAGIFVNQPPLPIKASFLLDDEGDIAALVAEIQRGLITARRLGIGTDLRMFETVAVPYFKSFARKESGFYLQELVSGFRCIKAFWSGYVDYEGSLKPCALLAHGGNIAQKSLQSEWKNLDPLRRNFRKGRFEPDCRYCFCNAGENILASLLAHPWQNRSLIRKLMGS
ncbi:MAG: radical SAM protein [Armatimonadetes bacterium]|nr:radical SAM protein [Armatimonadota bacterium]